MPDTTNATPEEVPAVGATVAVPAVEINGVEAAYNAQRAIDNYAINRAFNNVYRRHEESRAEIERVRLRPAHPAHQNLAALVSRREDIRGAAPPAVEEAAPVAAYFYNPFVAGHGERIVPAPPSPHAYPWGESLAVSLTDSVDPALMPRPAPRAAKESLFYKMKKKAPPTEELSRDLRIPGLPHWLHVHSFNLNEQMYILKNRHRINTKDYELLDFRSHAKKPSLWDDITLEEIRFINDWVKKVFPEGTKVAKRKSSRV